MRLTKNRHHTTFTDVPAMSLTTSDSIFRAVPPTMCTNDQSLTVAVIEQVANVLEEDPLALHPPLADVINPVVFEALERSDGEPEQTFTFTYNGVTVTVTNRNTVHVHNLEESDS